MPAIPSFQRHSCEPKQADHIVGEVGQQDSKDHIELKEADKTAAPLGRGDFRNVHGAEDGGATDGQSADDAETNQRGPAPGKGASHCGDDVEHGHDTQAISASVLVARYSCEHGADNRPEQRA